MQKAHSHSPLFCKQVLQHPSNQALPPQSRKLTTHPGGSGASGSAIQTNDSLVTIGIHFDPEEFVQKALDIGHPTRLHSFFPDEIEEVVNHCLGRSAASLAQDRTEEIKRWIHLKSLLSDEETALKENMSCRRKDVLKSKNLTLSPS